MRDMAPSYLLVDGYNIVSRAWYARFFHTKPDEPDAEEVARTAVAMVKNQATAIAIDDAHTKIIYDGGNIQRQRLYAGYKANRAPRPDGLFETLVRSIESFGVGRIATHTVPGWEADDVIATYHHRLREYGYGVAIYSSDSDLLQLLDDFTIAIQPLTGGKVRTWNKDEFASVYPFRPRSLPHYKAVKGEKDTDGYPGVPKVGEKTGKGLIGHCGTIDALYEGIGYVEQSLRSRLQHALVEHEAQVRLNLILATLMPVPGVTERSMGL